MHCLDDDFEQRVSDLLLYRRIVSVSENDQCAVLTLDNGVELVATGNEGCGGCGNGWFYPTHLECCDNAITRIECTEDYDDDNYNASFNIFVYANDIRINCLQYSGYDNGYYGVGYHLRVRFKGES